MLPFVQKILPQKLYRSRRQLPVYLDAEAEAEEAEEAEEAVAVGPAVATAHWETLFPSCRCGSRKWKDGMGLRWTWGWDEN